MNTEPHVNFSFPIGSFGVMLNRLFAERLIKPICCNGAATDAHTQPVCMRLEENCVEEQMAFQVGMSISGPREPSTSNGGMILAAACLMTGF
jgi:hypothetical protein